MLPHLMSACFAGPILLRSRTVFHNRCTRALCFHETVAVEVEDGRGTWPGVATLTVYADERPLMLVAILLLADLFAFSETRVGLLRPTLPPTLLFFYVRGSCT